MSSDKPSGADDQQERPSRLDWLDAFPPNVGHYVAGIVDGEGSFNVPIRRGRGRRSLPWRVSLSFNVSQVGAELPEFLRQTFGAGTVRGRGDGVFYYEVTKPEQLEDRVFPFFERFPLWLKAADLAVFREITALVRSGRHLSRDGIEHILHLRRPMNRGGKRRYHDDEIIAALARWESSEAIRRAPS